jgi:hypothetical protein
MAMPNTNQPAQEIVARPVNVAAADDANSRFAQYAPVGIQTALVYPAQTLAANSAVERQIVFYAGPKEYRTLARIGEEFKIAPTS